MAVKNAEKSLEKAIKEMEDASYSEFLNKFKSKKTTDDCYTPENVYEAVVNFVAGRYNLDKSNFRRVFWPGGDYQAEEYSPDDVVVDNPPFSILAQIVAWYNTNGIKFFLFAPTLTLFSSSSSSCQIPTGVDITYENGAKVNTSFLTNLEDAQVKTYPELYRVIKKANEYNVKRGKKSLPKYEYPDEIITPAIVARWCRHGVSYTLGREDCERIGALDAQRKVGKTIFGNGYILSERAAAERAAAERAAAERAAAERAAAERAAAERAAAERWQLSAREKNIVARLSGKQEIYTEQEIEGQVSIFDYLGGDR